MRRRAFITLASYLAVRPVAALPACRGWAAWSSARRKRVGHGDQPQRSVAIWR